MLSIAATRHIIALEEERLALLQRQLAYGAAAETDVLLQQTALDQARQTLPPLQSRLALQRNLLTALTWLCRHASSDTPHRRLRGSAFVFRADFA